jgi:uncharacterized paraquat-inducible protein A
MVDYPERKPNVKLYTLLDRRKPLSERLEERLEKLKKKAAFRVCPECDYQKPNTKVYFNDFAKCKLCQQVERDAAKRRHRIKDSAPVPATSR